MQASADVLVIGAGISGLSLAAFLGSADCLVVDRNDRPGGYCRTLERNGFVWDHSGHFFHFKHPEIRDYLMEHIRCEVLSVRKVSNIFYRGRLVDFPFQYNIDQLPVAEFVECLHDLCEAQAGEPDTSSFKAYVRSFLGGGICDRFVIPYNEKLYACDLDELDHDSMGRFFPPRIELRDLLRRLRERRSGASYNDHFIYPVLGAEEFVRSLLRRLRPGQVWTDTEVLSIDTGRRVARTTRGDVAFRRLVSTMPFDRLLAMTEPAGSPLRETPLSANKVAVFNLGFDRGSDNPAHWTYFPGDEVFYRVGFYNNILRQDRLSLYVEIGLPRSGAADEGRLLDRVLADLRRVGVIDSHRLVDHQFLVMDPAYAHITAQSRSTYAAWCQRHNPAGLHSIGRYGAWTYCSIEDNIVEARALAGTLSAG